MDGTDLKNMRELCGKAQIAIANAAAVDRSLLSLAECNLRPLAPDQEGRVIRALKKGLEQHAEKIAAALETL